MDFGPQNSLLQRITKEQLLAGKNKAILCVSRLDLRTFQDQLLRSSKILSNLYKVRDWVQLCGFSLHYLHATRCSKRCNFQLTSAAIWEVVTPTHLAVWTAGYPRSCKSQVSYSHNDSSCTTPHTKITKAALALYYNILQLQHVRTACSAMDKTDMRKLFQTRKAFKDTQSCNSCMCLNRNVLG